MTTLQKTIEQYNAQPNFCHWLQYQAAYVWERVAFSRQTNVVKTYEPTITQNLIFEFWQLALHQHFGIVLFEANDEKSNGNDIEFFIETNRGYVNLPMQAKILYEDGRYSQMPHGGPNRFQIDLLLDYARKQKGIPFYLLYNFYTNPTANQNIAKITGNAIELFGCSLASALNVKKNFFTEGPPRDFHTIPSFEAMHPLLASPWHHLVCPDRVSDFMVDVGEGIAGVRFYDYEEIFTDDRWRNLGPDARIGYIIEKATVQPGITRDAAVTFNPRYRIMVSGINNEQGLWRIY